MIEEWSAVRDYEGLYEVSNLGRVRSLVRQLPGPGGVVRAYGGKLLATSKRGGYAGVSLCKNGVVSDRQVHVLVCSAFHGPKPPSKDLVAHGDGDYLNNRADNLRWATYAENEQDKERHGTKLVGESTNNVKLTEDQVLRIRSMRGSIYEIAPLFGVLPAAIADIRRGKTWRHLPGAPAYRGKVNKRHFITIEGVTRSIPQWAKQFGISEWTVRRRIDRGWSPEFAVSTPLLKSRYDVAVRSSGAPHE